MRVAISGSRDVSPVDEPMIELRVAELVAEGATELIFGGARGVDTVALVAAAIARGDRLLPKLTVVVPNTVDNQPQEAQEWIRECADQVVELRQGSFDSGAYRKRNEEMLRRADRLVAFWDGRPGGTQMTIGIARRMELPVEVVPLHGVSIRESNPARPPRVFARPFRHWMFPPSPEVNMPVYIADCYVSIHRGGNRTVQIIIAMKGGYADPSAVIQLAERLAAVVKAHAELYSVHAIVPIPRRDPSQPNDLALLTQYVAELTGLANGTDILMRVEVPHGGVVRAWRERFPAEEHARTMTVDTRRIAAQSRIILLDNVVTFGGSMEGARRAVIRDRPEVQVVGLVCAGAGEFAP